MVHKIVTLLVTLGFLLVSCTQSPIVRATPTFNPTGAITPYHTITPSPDSPTATQIAIIPVSPAPSPTPFMHMVKKGETMLGIAFQYGISLEDLKAANPGVDPNFLSVDKQLVIPISGEIPETMPTPTPIPVAWQQPVCYRTGDGGAWCILPVKNQQENSVENISAWIGLFTSQGENITNQVAYAPLNQLRPGESIPLMSYFAPPLPDKFEAHGELLSGLTVAPDDTRYLNLEVVLDNVDISADGSQAMVKGEVILPDGVPMPSQIWNLIIAYDFDGNIIGARKWESSGGTLFELPVFSLGGAIDHVEVLIEARP
jgi:LysM repeat protein